MSLRANENHEVQGHARMALLALMVSTLLTAGPAAASNGDQDGRFPPGREGHERNGPMRESSKAKVHPPTPVGDGGVLGDHMNQDEINSGAIRFRELFAHGKHLFQAKFNRFDGQGRPDQTSSGGATANRPRTEENYLRVSGPDSTSCWQCHNLPRSGGGGDFNAIMHSGSHGSALVHDASNTSSNHRAGPSIFGAGAVEMLAREMTAELQAQRDAGKSQAATSGVPVTVNLNAKGVAFGSLIAHPDGKIDPTNIDGVDWDLVIKPHTHKGTGVSLRGFSTGGSNVHMGMQAVERFGAGTDPDGDGVTDELSIGDATALTVWMSALPVPGRVIPRDRGKKAAIERGEALFTQVGCASCHTPAMYLNNRFYSEPSPYNSGTTILKVSDVPRPFSYDLTKDGPGPRPERTSDGRAIVRAFTDLKRHNIRDAAAAPRQSDEIFPGAGGPGTGGSLRGTAPASDFVNAPTGAASFLGANVFMSERLWDVGSTAPYGHRADLTTLTDAIGAHGGDAASTRAAFQLLSAADQACLVDFLKSLQVVPQDSPRVTDEGDEVR